jgi:hypothetical protein
MKIYLSLSNQLSAEDLNFKNTKGYVGRKAYTRNRLDFEISAHDII